MLAQVAKSLKNGLVPNFFAEDGRHAYNSADASLWYAWSVQCYLKENPDGLAWVREHAWARAEGHCQRLSGRTGHGHFCG